MALSRLFRFGPMGCGALLLLLVLLVYGRHSYLRSAVMTLAKYGGHISEDEFPPYSRGPIFVTFNIPGLRVRPTDADAGPICQAISRFRRLDRIDFSETSLGDPFFVELAQQCNIRWVQLRHTQCGDLGVQALANNQATQWLDIEGLILSDETLALLKRKGIQHEYKPNALPFSVR